MKLKSCPFCGYTMGIYMIENIKGRVLHLIICDHCGSRGPHRTNKAAATKSWNTRPAETALLDRVRKKIEAYTILFTAGIRTNEAHNNALDGALRAVDEVEKEERT